MLQRVTSTLRALEESHTLRSEGCELSSLKLVLTTRWRHFNLHQDQQLSRMRDLHRGLMTDWTLVPVLLHMLMFSFFSDRSTNSRPSTELPVAAYSSAGEELGSIYTNKSWFKSSFRYSSTSLLLSFSQETQIRDPAVSSLWRGTDQQDELQRLLKHSLVGSLPVWGLSLSF